MSARGASVWLSGCEYSTLSGSKSGLMTVGVLVLAQSPNRSDDDSAQPPSEDAITDVAAARVNPLQYAETCQQGANAGATADLGGFALAALWSYGPVVSVVPILR